MTTRAEQRFIQRELIASTAVFFVVLAGLLLVLGFFIYHQVSENLFESIDNQLQTARASLSSGLQWDTVAPDVSGTVDSAQGGASAVDGQGSQTAVGGQSSQGDNQSTASEQNDQAVASDQGIASDQAATSEQDSDEDYQVAIESGLSGEFIEAIERNVGENPQLVFVIRDEQGAVTSAISLYAVAPDYLGDIPFEPNALDTAQLRSLDGHHLRMVTAAIHSDTQENSPITGYVQVVANVDSEIAILDTFTKTMVAGFSLALVLSAVASYLLSRRMVRPIARAWQKQSEFVQNASHELRTPLSVIKTTQELMLEHPNDRIVDRFEEITATIDESDRLARLAEDLLALTALDAGEADLEREEVDIDETVSSMVSIYREYVELQDKVISVEACSHQIIQADRAKIRQLLAIVLDNAVKYTDEGDTIDVRTSSEGKHVRIVVADSGIGITTKDAQNAFDRFYRADHARAANGGRGLGLAIAKGITEAHGGYISIAPNPAGTGTAVTIMFPGAVRK
ncbi:histidine kinase [Cryptobacterium curtum DSM 15641]|uniref:histidine kinase n=1 Tax=Cryptobacterium curtum (strain ATCC 700683 / DSM 15641 / CCUG 43107 / 12-3) TaxID=469378 RepID=C7MPA5_CRYCD|nr:ATP-binding protein [Cryptobacterium curtum]ACU94745.1 histidine kinase [Cryptobacterium curtum DSM 15641]